MPFLTISGVMNKIQIVCGIVEVTQRPGFLSLPGTLATSPLEAAPANQQRPQIRGDLIAHFRNFTS